MALKDAAGPEEIAAIDKRMVVHNGILRKNGPAKFGTAEGLSYILLTVMKHSPETRCIMSIAYGDDIMDVMEEVGMTSVTAEMGKDKFSEATEKALRKCKGIPDAIVDKGPKKDRNSTPGVGVTGPTKFSSTSLASLPASPLVNPIDIPG